MREHDIRELMLPYGAYLQFRTPRAAKAAYEFILSFAFPMRTVIRGCLFEIGGQDKYLLKRVVRMIRAKGYGLQDIHPWKPPMELHSDFKMGRMV